MKLNFSLHLESEGDKQVFRGFATASPLMWDTDITTDTPAEDAFEVLLTDSAKEVDGALPGKRPNSEIVFVGDMAEVESAYASLFDVWPREESAETRKARIEKLIGNLQARFDAWHYENMLTTVIDSVPDLVWFKDRQGAHMMVNQEFCEMVHKTKEDVRGRSHSYIWDISEDEYEKGEFVCAESDNDTMKAGKTCTFDESLKTSEGMKRLKTYKTPLFDMFGNIEGTVGVAKDVTDVGNMGLELSILIECIPLPLIICDVNWRTVKMNDAFGHMTGVEDGPISDFHYREWLLRNLVPIGDEKVNEQSRSKVCEYVLNLDGQSQYYLVTEQEIVDYFQNTSGYFVVLRDVTALRNHEKMVLSEANTDSLTGLYNRRYFDSFLNKHLGKPLSLIYMGLDRFNEINTNFGHKRGDDILKGTAEFMRDCFGDGWVSRLGGDTFAVIMEKLVPEEEVKRRCEELNKKICTLFRSGDLQVSVSYGISVSNGNRNIDGMLREADDRMYRYKQNKMSAR